MHHKKLYVMYDNNAETTIGYIWQHPNDGAALREFYDILNNKETLPGQHPEDFDLLLIGNLDLVEATITSDSQRVARGRDWLDAMKYQQTVKEAQNAELRQDSQRTPNETGAPGTRHRGDQGTH